VVAERGRLKRAHGCGVAGLLVADLHCPTILLERFISLLQARTYAAVSWDARGRSAVGGVAW
jgi:hypothetical protein